MRIGRSRDRRDRTARSYFLNVHVPPPRLIIDRRGAYQPGAGADGGLARLRRRPSSIRARAFATPDRFPGVTVIAEWPDEAFQAIGLDVYTAVVAADP